MSTDKEVRARVATDIFLHVYEKEKAFLTNKEMARKAVFLADLILDELEKPVEIKQDMLTLLQKPISDFSSLSMRARSVFRTKNIKTLADLVRWSKSDLQKIRNVGSKTIKEIEVFLDNQGLSLGMSIF